METVFPAVIERYNRRSSVTTDTCGSLRKQVADIVKPMVNKGECEQLLSGINKKEFTRNIAHSMTQSGASSRPRHSEDGMRIPNTMADNQENALQKKEM